MSMYKLIWDDFCSWYLEIIKPKYGEPIDKKTYLDCINYLEKILKLLHPFMPFLTEEIWHLISNRKEGEDIIVSSWPDSKNIDKKILEEFGTATEIIVGIRNIRKEYNISTKEQLELKTISNNGDNNRMIDVIIKLGGLISYEKITKKTEARQTKKEKASEEEKRAFIGRWRVAIIVGRRCGGNDEHFVAFDDAGGDAAAAARETAKVANKTRTTVEKEQRKTSRDA